MIDVQLERYNNNNKKKKISFDLLSWLSSILKEVFALTM